MPASMSSLDAADNYFFTNEPLFALSPDTLSIGYYAVSFSVRDNDGNWSVPYTDTLIITESLPVNENITKPEATRITSVSPNPFNSTVSISFNSEADSDILIIIHDVRGIVTELIPLNRVSGGTNIVSWDAGFGTPSGTYYIRLLENGVEKGTARALLVK
jgi:hypothetical protein